MFANDMNNKLFLSIFECKLFIISLHSLSLNDSLSTNSPDILILYNKNIHSKHYIA